MDMDGFCGKDASLKQKPHVRSCVVRRCESTGVLNRHCDEASVKAKPNFEAKLTMLRDGKDDVAPIGRKACVGASWWLIL